MSKTMTRDETAKLQDTIEYAALENARTMVSVKSVYEQDAAFQSAFARSAESIFDSIVSERECDSYGLERGKPLTRSQADRMIKAIKSGEYGFCWAK